MSGSHAGWYPDDQDPTLARYWDGVSWTDQTRPLEGLEPAVVAHAGGTAASAPPPSAGSRLDAPAGSPPAAATGTRRSWVRHPATWAITLIAVVALAAAAVVVLTGDEAAATPVALEPAGDNGTDPFMDSIATDAVDPDGIEPGGVEAVSTNPDQPVTTLTGDTPGLYGGTGNDTVCDPTALVDFLDNHPDKAQAFATVQGIAPDGIADFVATLTPVLLREDTRVTNHGFTNGTATPLQSVLQAGTAVLVDQRGVPRVRCACGNPLTEPAGTPTTNLTFTGTTWNGFDDTRLLTVTPSPQPLDTLTITDITTGQTQDIPTGTTASGSGGGGGGDPMTLDRLLNVTVPEIPPTLSATQLTDGVSPPDEFNQPGPSVDGIDPSSGREPQAFIADFTGDGVDDGLLVLTTMSCGASCSTTYYALLYDSDGTFLARVPVEENAPGASPSYEVTGVDDDGTIEFDVRSFAPTDNNADGPSLRTTVRLRWDGTQFVAA